VNNNNNNNNDSEHLPSYNESINTQPIIYPYTMQFNSPCALPPVMTTSQYTIPIDASNVSITTSPLTLALIQQQPTSSPKIPSNEQQQQQE